MKITRNFRDAVLGAAALVVVLVFAQQPADVVVVLYPPNDCGTDFDAGYWTRYDSAMPKSGA